MFSLKHIVIIIKSTLHDELHHKSVYLLSGLAVIFIFLLRGCFDNDVMVNGQRLDGVTIGWHASLIAFHLISIAGVIIGMLLGMRILRRDKASGNTSAMLAKPVSRIEYILAKIIGVWILAYGLTFILHLTVYGIMLFKTGGGIVFFVPASLLVSLNVLFAVLLVMVMSQFVPDIVAALFSGGIWLIGYISDSIYWVSQNGMVKNVLDQMQRSEQPIALWRMLWPKMTSLQYYAVSLVKEVPVQGLGVVHPSVNVAGYTLVAFCILWWHFSREEIR